VSGAIQTAWIKQGWEAGALGYPTGDQVCGLVGGGCKQDFQGGTLYSLPAAGTNAVAGDLATAWTATGAEGGPLGYPTSGLICGLKNSGCGQVFQDGRIYRTSGTGAHAVSGAIQTAWIAQGWEGGPLGYPTGDQVCGLAGGGCKQDFQGGTIYSLSSAGAFPVTGDIATAWQAAGGEGGTLGYPTTGLICGLKNSGCGQVFQGGTIYRTATTGTHAVSGSIQSAWVAQGWETGPLGYPTGDQTCGLPGGGCSQQFQGGSLLSATPGGVAYAVQGAALDRYTAAGGPGTMGFPTGAERCGLTGGGCRQDFQSGIITRSSVGTHAVTGPMLTVWARVGAEASGYGYPATDMECGLVGGGCRQQFQGFWLYWSAANGREATPIFGDFLATWIARGAENGSLGYPLIPQTRYWDGHYEMDFDHGRILWYPGTGFTVLTWP